MKIDIEKSYSEGYIKVIDNSICQSKLNKFELNILNFSEGQISKVSLLKL